jgi:hypothetical protein
LPARSKGRSHALKERPNWGKLAPDKQRRPPCLYVSRCEYQR